MTTTFAASTRVSEDKSRQEIERMLVKSGASRFGTITDLDTRKAVIGFVFRKIQFQMQIPLPDRKSRDFTHPKRGYGVHPESKQTELYEAEIRRRWRCLTLALKAKLVAISDGISTFEHEFLPYAVTASGETVGERLKPVMEFAASSGGVVPATLMLPEAAS